MIVHHRWAIGLYYGPFPLNIEHISVTQSDDPVSFAAADEAVRVFSWLMILIENDNLELQIDPVIISNIWVNHGQSKGWIINHSQQQAQTI